MMICKALSDDYDEYNELESSQLEEDGLVDRSHQESTLYHMTRVHVHIEMKVDIERC